MNSSIYCHWLSAFYADGKTPRYNGNISSRVFSGGRYDYTYDGRRVQDVWYYPYGEPLRRPTASFSHSSSNRYLFGDKEYANYGGESEYDFGARTFTMSVIPMATRPDPLTEKRPWESPFITMAGNPIMYVDPAGKEVYIFGTEAQAALAQLQAKAGESITLKFDKDNPNKLIYEEQNPEKGLRGAAKKIAEIINSSDITVNLKTTNEKLNSLNKVLLGGAFMGNIVTEYTTDDNRLEYRVEANQEINPTILEVIDTATGKPGNSILHELTEAYEGAKISKAKKKNAGVGSENNPVYNKAHERATSQAAEIVQLYYDKDNNVLEMRNGVVPPGTHHANYYIRNKNGEWILIMSYP